MKKYLIANWKMQLSRQEAVELSHGLKKYFENLEDSEKKALEVVLCASFTALESVQAVIADSQLKLGAQNVFYHGKGQYTGEVSPTQLKEVGVEHVIVGHSERRNFLEETDEQVNRKILSCLENDLTPVVCIGETADERREGKTEVAIIRQVTRCLEDVELKNGQKLILAYEPVWAISPAPPATPTDAEEAIHVINHLLRDFFDEDTIKNQIVTVYGGSVSADNVGGFLAKDNISGGLVGGAGLSLEKFAPLIDNVINLK